MEKIQKLYQQWQKMHPLQTNLIHQVHQDFQKVFQGYEIYKLTHAGCVSRLTSFPDYSPYHKRDVGKRTQHVCTLQFSTRENSVWHYEACDLIRGIFVNEDRASNYLKLVPQQAYAMGDIFDLCTVVEKGLSQLSTTTQHLLAVGTLIFFGNTVAFPGFDTHSQCFKPYPLGLGSLEGYDATAYAYVAVDMQ